MENQVPSPTLDFVAIFNQSPEILSTTDQFW